MRTLIFSIALVFVCACFAQGQTSPTLHKTKSEIDLFHSSINQLSIYQTTEGIYTAVWRPEYNKLVVNFIKTDGSGQIEKEFRKRKLEKVTYIPFRFFTVNDHIYIVYMVDKYKNRHTTFYAFRVDPKTLEPESKGKKLLEYTYSTPLGWAVVTQLFRIKTNGKNANFNIIVPSNDLTDLHVYCFDSTQKLTGSPILYNWSFKQESRQELMDAAGNLYYLYQEETAESVQPALAGFTIVKFCSDGSIINKRMELLNGYVRDARMVEDTRGSIIVGGYYSEDTTAPTIRGVFRAQLDSSTLDLSDIKKIPFTIEDRLKALREEQRAEYAGKNADQSLEIPDYYLKQLVLDDKNQLYIIGENYLKQRYVIYTSNPTSAIPINSNTYIGISTRNQTGGGYRYEFEKILVSCPIEGTQEVKNTFITNKIEYDGANLANASVLVKPAEGGGLNILFNSYSREKLGNSMVFMSTQILSDGEASQKMFMCDFTQKPVGETTKEYKCNNSLYTNPSYPMHDGSVLVLLTGEKLQVCFWK